MADGRVRVDVGEQDILLWKQSAIRIRTTQALLTGCGDPTASSPLALDDTDGVGGHLSDAVRSYLRAAVDNLLLWANTVAPLVFVEGTSVENPPRPYFTLARAGLESAAQAAWVLEPKESAERVERHLRLAADDLKNMGVTAQHIDAAASAALAERIAQIRASHPTEIKKAPAFLDMVRSVAPHAGMAPDDAEVLWRTASAAAHGKPWFLDATHTTTRGDEFAAGQYRAVRTPDPGTISAITTFATSVTERTTLRFAQMLGADLNDLIQSSLASVQDNMPRAIPLTDGGGIR